MLDRFNREINYLRISVTDKCNLACQYCMPDGVSSFKPYHEILRYEEVYAIVKEAVELGIDKVRLTGGEPLLRKNLAELVAQLSSISKLKCLALTTNGTLLVGQAKELKAAGLQKINISLDTLDAEKYKIITGSGVIDQVLAGIEVAISEDFIVKINMVVLSSTTQDEIAAMRKFCAQREISLQLISGFDLSQNKMLVSDYDRPQACTSCNRLRLLADGTLKPCLHSDLEYKIDMQNIRSSLMQAILAKPKDGGVCKLRSMVQIGG